MELKEYCSHRSGKGRISSSQVKNYEHWFDYDYLTRNDYRLSYKTRGEEDTDSLVK